VKGIPPAEAMRCFEDWVLQVAEPPCKPIFVAFNAPFDWMFVNDYFHRFLGRNPFGHSAVDTKALYMGLARVPWAETSMKVLVRRYPQLGRLAHHALEDALQQAELLRLILAEFDG
jgi:ribonuclease T